MEINTPLSLSEDLLGMPPIRSVVGKLVALVSDPAKTHWPYFAAAGRICLKRSARAGVVFTCVVDPNVELAIKRIQTMQKGPHGDKWSSTKAYKTSKEMIDSEVGVHASPPGSLPQSLFDRTISNRGQFQCIAVVQCGFFVGHYSEMMF